MGNSHSHKTTSRAPAASSSNNPASAVVHGGPAQASYPWTLCRDPSGRLFLWNTYTAVWTYNIPANVDCSNWSPLPSEFPHRDVAPDMLVSPRVGAGPRPREKRKTVEPPRRDPYRPIYWERVRDESGNDVWIHPVTNKHRYEDPYE